MLRQSVLLLSSLFILRMLHADGGPEVRNEVIVSVKEQKLMLLQNGARVTTYPVSTSKFGIGDASRQNDHAYRRDGGRAEDWRPRADRCGFPSSPLYRRNHPPERSGTRSGHHAHHLAARSGSVDFTGFQPMHLHPRHAGREEDRPAGELRLYPDEVQGCHGPLQSASDWVQSCRSFPTSCHALPRPKSFTRSMRRMRRWKSGALCLDYRVRALHRSGAVSVRNARRSRNA